MNAERDFTDYLSDILSAIEAIEQFVQGMDYAQFAADRKTIFAVIRGFEIIGEAARQIPASERDRYPHVPWRDIVGMRNRLVHGYFQVDLDVVWKAIQRDLPVLRPLITQMLTEATQGDRSDAN
jgi:uncharacterized protein with HEPN domain